MIFKGLCFSDQSEWCLSGCSASEVCIRRGHTRATAQTPSLSDFSAVPSSVRNEGWAMISLTLLSLLLLATCYRAGKAARVFKNRRDGVESEGGGAHARISSLRGDVEKHNNEGRTLQSSEVFCNALGCPDGLMPIPDAGLVPCADGICTETQCCEAYCSGFACNESTVPISDADTVLCPNNYCTQDLCCEAYCSSFGCPDGFIPVDNAQSITCADDGCSVGECCIDLVADTVSPNVYCNTLGCSDGLVPIADPESVVCTNGICIEALCCQALCSSFACPDDFVPINDAALTECSESVCTVAECCVAA